MTIWKRISRKTVLLAAALVLLVLVSGAAGQSGGTVVFLPLVMQIDPNLVYQGVATYYDATGAGACSFGPSPSDLMVAAMNGAQYGSADFCGAYVRVSGPRGEVTVRIVDLCPGCGAGHLDLSREAFAQIASLPQGRVPITWKVVSPDLPGPVGYHIKEGSNVWWMAVQVRNHRNPIEKLEVQTGSGWVNLPRQSYNYFVKSDRMDPGPYTFRITDWYGNTLIDSGIPLRPGETINGAGQFPPGP